MVRLQRHGGTNRSFLFRTTISVASGKHANYGDGTIAEDSFEYGLSL